MALTIALVISLVAAANAAFSFASTNQQPFQPFQPVQLPNFPSIQMPQMPRLPTLPQPPYLGGFPFAGFQVPFIPFPNIPAPGDIENVKPGPNQNFQGVAVKSSSGFTTDKEGKTVRTGGTSFVVNNNGDVLKKEVGDNPPNLNEPIVFICDNQTRTTKHMSQMPKMPAFKMPEFKPFVMPPMQPIVPIPPIIIDPIDIENRVPGEGENFVGVATHVYSHSENINGVETSGGGCSSVVNNNGEVEKEAVVFGQGDKE